MELTPGMKVKHAWLPGTFIVQGPPEKSEIGWILVPVMTEQGATILLHPDGLTKVEGGCGYAQTNSLCGRSAGDLSAV